ncbi:hypothetical protein [Geomicrobium sp. JCM 19055]|uniref:hypothetical protein n=1 Tax=Geomicrobium sp. JCM 19055 TaxID=1460649 RepID=UPI0012679101|nr:hypothetical protein [Geomicrobium sp. JCM 19055]
MYRVRTNKWFLVMFVVLLSACTLEEEEPVEEEQPEHEEQIESTYEFGEFSRFEGDSPSEWMQAEPGSLYNEPNDEEKALKILREQAGNDVSESQLYYQMLDLVASDYREYHEYFGQLDDVYDDIVEASAQVREDALQMNVHVIFDAHIEAFTTSEIEPLLYEFLMDMPDDTNVSLKLLGSGRVEEPCETSVDEDSDLLFNEKEAESLHVESYDETPIAHALNSVENIFPSYDEDRPVKNVVYLIAANQDNCDGVPEEVASELDAIINVIGFDVEEETDEYLKAIATAGNGNYVPVTTVEELTRTIEIASIETIQLWRDWQVEWMEDERDRQMVYIDESREQQDEMVEETRLEQERLRALTDQLEEEFNLNGSMIRSNVNERAVALRNYMEETSLKFRDEAFQAGTMTGN